MIKNNVSNICKKTFAAHIVLMIKNKFNTMGNREINTYNVSFFGKYSNHYWDKKTRKAIVYRCT